MRRRGLTRAQFFVVLREIGIRKDDIVRAVESGKTFEEKQAALDAFKGTIRKAFKRRLFEVHPDRNSGDPEAEEKCKALNTVRPMFMQVVDTLHVIKKQPKRQVVHRVDHRSLWTQRGVVRQWTATDSGTTTTMTNAGGSVFHVWVRS